MKATGEEVKAAAADARLSFSSTEEESLREKVQQVFEDIREMKNYLDTTDFPPLYYPLERENVYREDRREQSLTREKALANGPDTDSECFHVPRIIES